MNVSSTIRTLPITAALALGLALAPAISMAKGGFDRDNVSHGQSYSHNGAGNHGNNHGNSHGYDHGGDKRVHNGRGYDRDWHDRGHEHGHYDRRVVKNYIYPAHPHTVTEYVVHDYAPRHYLSLGDLGFIIGLHTDDIDIILHK